MSVTMFTLKTLKLMLVKSVFFTMLDFNGGRSRKVVFLMGLNTDRYYDS